MDSAALHTDLYQLTMAAGYFAAGKHRDRAIFELFVRNLPERRPYLIAAGLEQAVDYLLRLRFSGSQIDYLRGLPVFERATSGFFEYLREFRFAGDLFAMREGTPFYAGEPVLTVRGSLIEAQLPETYLLSTIAFQSMIASKAALVVAAADGRAVVEFGSRRAHGPEAGVLAGRAAYIGGCAGTSNVETGKRFGIPVFGTAAHSWIMAFGDEKRSFEELHKLLGPSTVYLLDTYDTIQAAHAAVSLGHPLWGVRLDSGDIAALARQVRRILDEGGLRQAKIMASGDLNEDRLRELAGAPIDAYGVGTELSTSADAPSVGAVYKLAEIRSGEEKRYTAKYSGDKITYPGAKQVFRFPGYDLIGRSTECPSCDPGTESSEALLRPVILEGKLVESLPDVHAARSYSARARPRSK